MNWFARTALGAAAAAAAIASRGQAQAADAPPTTPSAVPTEAFFSFDYLSNPVISPDGDALAMLVRNKEGRRQLAVLDTADLSKAQVVASFNDADITGLHRVNAKRLVFTIFHENEAYFDQTASGLYAVDRNGDSMRTLIRPSWERDKQTGKLATDRSLDPDNVFTRTLADGSDDVIVRRYTYVYNSGEPAGSIPMRLNTRNGSVHSLVEGNLPGFTYDWFVGPAGELLGGVSSNEGKSAVLVRSGTAWKEVNHFPSYESSEQSIDFLPVGADARSTSPRASARTRRTPSSSSTWPPARRRPSRWSTSRASISAAAWCRTSRTASCWACTTTPTRTAPPGSIRRWPRGRRRSTRSCPASSTGSIRPIAAAPTVCW